MRTVSCGPQEPSGPAAFRAAEGLAGRQRRAFWVVLVIALLGRWVHAFAHGWLIYRLTASPLWLSMASAAVAVGALPVAVWCGNRAPTRHAAARLGLAQMGLMAIALACSLAAWLDHISPVLLLCVAAAYGGCGAMDASACAELVGDMSAERDRVRAGRLHSWLINLTRATAPLLAGSWLVAGGDIAACFLFNAACLMPMGVWAALICRRPRRPSGRQCRMPLRADVHAESAAAMPSILLLAAFTALAMPIVALLPVVAQGLGGAVIEVLRRLTCGIGAGALIMATLLWLLPVASPAQVLRGARAAVLAAGGLIASAPFIAGETLQWIWSLGMGSTMACVFGLLVPELHRGSARGGRRRHLAWHVAIQMGLSPLATLCFGAVAACGGLVATLSGAGLLLICAPACVQGMTSSSPFRLEASGGSLSEQAPGR